MANEKEVLRIQELKVIAEAAYEEYHVACKKLYDKVGESQHSIEIEPTADGKNWLRLTLTDNAARLKSGEIVVGISIVREVGAKVEYLKNKPKE